MKRKENIRLVLIDNNLYEVSLADYEKFISAVCSCCGCCDEYSLQDVREECLRIKKLYKPIDFEGPHFTPENQFPEEEPELHEEIELPF